MTEHLRSFVAAIDTRQPTVTTHDGVVASPITATTCFLFLDGDDEVRTEPDMENPIGPVKYETHVAPLVVGNVVRVTKTGAAVRVTGRLA